MKALPQFRNMDQKFWAHIRILSEGMGYTQKGNKKEGIKSSIKKLQINEIYDFLKKREYNTNFLFTKTNEPSQNAELIVEYISERSRILNTIVESCLMNELQAKRLFKETRKNLKSKLPVIYNKQRGKMKRPAYLTNLVGMIVDHYCEKYGFVQEPRTLCVFTDSDNSIFYSTSRRFDGVFPTIKNPIAVWEIKEYYYTTTFGSRIADGVYESLLDGFEINEIKKKMNRKLFHCIIIDSHLTFWEMGKSYLCRYFDLLNMGYADEILFGSEVVEVLPSLVNNWKKELKKACD